MTDSRKAYNLLQGYNVKQYMITVYDHRRARKNMKYLVSGMTAGPSLIFLGGISSDEIRVSKRLIYLPKVI